MAKIIVKKDSAIKNCENNYFSLRLLALSLQYTMIDPSTWRISFLYIPAQPFEAPGSLREFLNEIIQYSVFDTSEDTYYIEDYIRMINSGTIITWQAVEEYADVLASQIQAAASIYERRCYRCNTVLGNEETVCPGCGTEFQTPSNFNKAPEFDYCNAGDAPDTDILFSNLDETPFSDSGTELSGGLDDTGIICVFKPADTTAPTAYLISPQNNNCTPITKTPFIVGKLQWETDLFLPQKNVSRRHASFHYENGEYYVSDLSSTNGTFLNGKKLESLNKYKISQGDIICFAREEFIFKHNKDKEN